MKLNRKSKIVHTNFEEQILSFSSYMKKYAGARQRKTKPVFVPFILSEFF